jgi:hypothetical protein
MNAKFPTGPTNLDAEVQAIYLPGQKTVKPLEYSVIELHPGEFYVACDVSRMGPMTEKEAKEFRAFIYTGVRKPLA